VKRSLRSCSVWTSTRRYYPADRIVFTRAQADAESASRSRQVLGQAFNWRAINSSIPTFGVDIPSGSLTVLTGYIPSVLPSDKTPQTGIGELWVNEHVPYEKQRNNGSTDMIMTEPLEYPVKVTEPQIRVVAYQLWEKAGNPAGRDLQFWLAAEAQLRAVLKSSPRIPVSTSPRVHSENSTVHKPAGAQSAHSRPDSSKAQPRAPLL
jgi:hypothetical protein